MNKVYVITKEHEAQCVNITLSTQDITPLSLSSSIPVIIEVTPVYASPRQPSSSDIVAIVEDWARFPPPNTKRDQDQDQSSFL